MSVEKALQLVSFPAAADLSTKQYHIVDMESDGEVTFTTAATDVPVGILQNKPAAAARAASVAVGGITKVAASSTAAAGGFAIGTQLVSNAVGRVVEFAGSNASHYILGRALEATTTGTAAGTGNSIITMQLTYEGFGSTV